MDDARWEQRKPKGGQYSLAWKGRDSKTHSTEARGLDVSANGVGIESTCELKAGAIVHVRAQDGSIEGDCEVVHCTWEGTKFHIGFEFREDRKQAEEPRPHQEARVEQSRIDRDPDYYETLQISRKADYQTINRVFHIMAARFHPDNPETGDVEQFLRMKSAYAVLSDPDRRLEYDAKLEKDREAGPRPIFALKDFVTGVEAEANRRLGVLSLLYNQRQTNPERPGVSLLDLEREMGFPREYLSFTLWYLRSKDFVNVGDNSDYALTAAGADYVEKKAVRSEIVSQLLNQGVPRVPPSFKSPKVRRNTASQPHRQVLLPASKTVPDLG